MKKWFALLFCVVCLACCSAGKQGNEEPQKANVNGTELFYVTYGSGRPIMFMHGGLGADHTYLKYCFKDELEEEYTLIFYDHRGNGRSRPASLEGVTHETWAADADALRHHLGFDKIFLVGHSYGGFLAQEYAARYSDHLYGLVLLSTASVLDYPDRIMENAQARAATPEIVAAVQRAFSPDPVSTDAEFKQLMDTLGPLYFVHPEKFTAEAEAMMKGVSYSAAAWNHVNKYCLPTFNMLPKLGDVQVPALVVSGQGDWITPVAEGGQRIHDALPDSEFAVFAESGHYPFVEERAEFFKILKEWLARH